MKPAIPIVCLLALTSCAQKPFVVKQPNGTVIASLGWDFLEKSETETASITLPDGTHMTHTKTGKDQTGVAKDYIRGDTMVGLADAANVGEGIRVKGDVAKGAQAAGVEKARIDGDVKVKTFVPHEPVPAP